MDIYLLIVIDPSTHPLEDAQAEAARYSRGDIVGGGLATNIATLVGDDYEPNDVIGSVRLGFIFVRNVPNRAISVLKRFDESRHGTATRQIEMTTEEYDNREPGPLGPFSSEPIEISRSGNMVLLEGLVVVLLAKRRFSFRASDVPQAARALLLNQRHITVTWAQVKTMLREKLEGRYVTDSDLD